MKSEFSSWSLQFRVLKSESKSSVQVQAFHLSIQACFIQHGQLRFRGIKVEVDPSSAQPCIIYYLVWLKHQGELLKGLALTKGGQPRFGQCPKFNRFWVLKPSLSLCTRFVKWRNFVRTWNSGFTETVTLKVSSKSFGSLERQKNNCVNLRLKSLLVS